ncbi:NAD(P)/FAD-dependent oxidoreductase [Variovorax sp. LT2P21]|uniref:NAD(P)/FAD-dependent oxidoreductase n=1 Tax=Variovorax sp. LT2P21 TaxID=3443731 RepID=UPI003F4506F2
MTGRCVIVGASLAGLRAAEGLRDAGHDGEIVLVGAERYRPYDRPPLSKAVLAGKISADHIDLPERRSIDAEWRLGVAATRLDRAARSLRLSDGAELNYDRLLIATGTRANPWPNKDEARLAGVFTLRDRDDVASLKGRLEATDGRIVIVGGGFIGCEIATICRHLGRPVTVVEMGPVPMQRGLGRTIGDLMARRHQAQGVDLRTNAGVTALLDDGRRNFTGVRLTDGGLVEGDLCILALGAARNTEWLSGSGLRIDRLGLHADAQCRALREDGSPAERVFVAGDVAVWPSRLLDKQMAIEHWSNANEQARTAAFNMVAPNGAMQEHDYLPTFWSNQAGVTIKAVGMPSIADRAAVMQGSLTGDGFVALFGREGRTVGAISIDRGRFLDFYARLIRDRAPFPESIRTVDGGQIASFDPGFAQPEDTPKQEVRS